MYQFKCYRIVRIAVRDASVVIRSSDPEHPIVPAAHCMQFVSVRLPESFEPNRRQQISSKKPSRDSGLQKAGVPVEHHRFWLPFPACPTSC